MGEHHAAATSTSFLAAHPVVATVVGAVLLGVGAYYLGKYMANRASDKKEEAAVEPSAA